jgi:multiple sugar transport system permease protein
MSAETEGFGRRRSGLQWTAVRWVENLSEAQFAYLLLTPMLVLMGVIAFWPLLRTFTMPM